MFVKCNKNCFTVPNPYDNHNIGSIADYDPIKKQQSYSGIKYVNKSESQNYNFGVYIYILIIIYYYIILFHNLFNKYFYNITKYFYFCNFRESTEPYMIMRLKIWMKFHLLMEI